MKRTSPVVIAAAILVGLAGAAGMACKKKTPLTPPPAPLRPKPIVDNEIDTAPTRTDCDPTFTTQQEPARTYAERKPRIEEAASLAAKGLANLQAAEGGSLDDRSREDMITDAVDLFLKALAADPYNVNATYNLAAAYARIKRRQCALNMLDRLILMRDHESRQDEVKAKLDRLLGRNGVSIDPDFNDLRDDDTFGCLITNIGSAQPKDCFAQQ